MPSIKQECRPSLSIITISPGLTSRTKFAPTASSAQVSLAYIVAFERSYAERAYSVRIAHGYEFINRHYNERVRAFEFWAGTLYTRYDVPVG